MVFVGGKKNKHYSVNFSASLKKETTLKLDKNELMTPDLYRRLDINLMEDVDSDLWQKNIGVLWSTYTLENVSI